MKKFKLLKLTRIVGILFLIAMAYRLGLSIVRASHPILPYICYQILDIAILIDLLSYLYFFVALILSYVLKQNSIRHWIYFIIAFILGFILLFISVLPASIDKPIIYIYPTEDNTELTLKLSNKDIITTSYPKYNDGWNIVVNKDGNIYDKNTNRNYYGLYWEGIDNSKIDMSEGFVVKGKDTVSFLEEKLEYLGLNEREIEEFIIYWLPKLENNKYNYLRFRTNDEINELMDLEINHDVDTEIRVYMDFKKLNKMINVKEQTLTKVERSGFTIVEWGARELK